MEHYKLENDIKTFGVQVTTFPNGIKEAFNKLDELLPGDERPFYGICKCLNGNTVYIAAALETYDGEGKKLGYENYTIEKGKYATETLMDWPSKTQTIKDIFGQLGKEGFAYSTKPFVEVYKSMKEMVCMVKVDLKLQLKSELDKALNQFMQLIASLDDEQLNKKPFEGSWSAGGIAEHLIMSNKGFVEIINGPDKETERAPDKLEETIKRDFGDFSFKMDAPEFVWPKNSRNNKHELLHSLGKLKGAFEHAIETLDLSKTCLAFEVPVYGYLTRLEAIWFIICHTTRHAHQLKNIKNKLTKIPETSTLLTT